MSGARPTVGFIGLGAIGAPMARRTVEAGYDLVVHDIDEAALRRFAGSAHLAGSARDVADRAAIAEADRPGAPVAMTRAVLDLFERAMADGVPAGGDRTELVRAPERRADVEIPRVG